MQMLRRLSFTSRLMLMAFIAAIGPIGIAYVALLDLPGRVAGDSLELTMRETSQAVIASVGEERLLLREEVSQLADDTAFRRAIVNRDDAVIQGKLARSNPELQFSYIDSGSTGNTTTPVNAPIIVTSGNRTRAILVQRPVDDDKLASLAGDPALPVALVRDGEVVSRTEGFPGDIELPSERLLSNGLTTSREVEAGDETIRMLVKPVGLDPNYQLVTISTPEIEAAALAAPRLDVLRTLGFLGLATAAFAMAGAVAVNRSVGRFSDQTRKLALGEYSARLPVRGSDSFAGLAADFNTLASELERRISELQEAASRFSRTLETIEEGICVWSPDGTIELWNSGAERMTGIGREKLDDQHQVARFLREERAPGTRRLALPASRSGQRLMVDMVVTPMPGGGVLQTFRDITSVEMLHQTRRNFMTTAAHELRTPLTTILGFSQTLTNPSVPLSDEQREEFLGLIHEQAQHLQRLTDAFFTNQQLANERVEVSAVSVPLAEVVAEGIDKARVMPGDVDRVDRCVTVSIDPDICVTADRRALAGVVAVLLDNAWKYGADPVTIGADAFTGTAVLRVHDMGGGIELQHLDRIFDPFYRVDVDMRSGVGGAGLGLFTARKLVKAMRGVISVASAQGTGTTFSIELPMAVEGRPPVSGGARPAARPAAGGVVNLPPEGSQRGAAPRAGDGAPDDATRDGQCTTDDAPADGSPDRSTAPQAGMAPDDQLV